MFPIGNSWNPCAGCTACCRYVAVPIDEPEDRHDYDQVLWYLLHENVGVFIDDGGEWNVEFRTVCRALQPDGLCSIHLFKPLVCKEHEATDCEGKSTETPYQVYFTSAEQFVAYMEARGWSREGFGSLRERPGGGAVRRSRTGRRIRRSESP
ncbi:MAG: YkgJ family cysteine cluster protein [Planctomycetes bacterium]|nr:YkgJ family cysteine cluster protein [Planctomycetota bacterium]